MSAFSIKQGDTLFVFNLQPQKSYVKHLNYLKEQHKKGMLKVKKLPSQV